MATRTGITLAEASRRTGLTVCQLRWRVRRDAIRHRKAGGYVMLHPEDVRALETETWAGRPVEVAK